MALVLAIETATDVCSAALADDGQVLAERFIAEPRRHSERLLDLIDGVLEDGDASRAHLHSVAVSAGPGSYTGLRIGVSTAKGICQAARLPLMAVPSLTALALEAAPRSSGLLGIAFRSRRDEVYAALFDLDDDGFPVVVAPAAAGTPDQVVGAWASAPQCLAGDGADRLAAAVGPGARILDDVRPSASAVARLAHRHRPIVDVAAFEPYYLKEFVARHASRSVFDRLPF